MPRAEPGMSDGRDRVGGEVPAVSFRGCAMFYRKLNVRAAHGSTYLPMNVAREHLVPRSVAGEHRSLKYIQAIKRKMQQQPPCRLDIIFARGMLGYFCTRDPHFSKRCASSTQVCREQHAATKHHRSSARQQQDRTVAFLGSHPIFSAGTDAA